MPLQTINRPATFSQFLGNTEAIASLKSVLAREEDVPHVFLITGPAGAGKTTLAYIIRNELKCNQVDTYLYNAANARGIDTIREITENAQYSPLYSKTKFIIMDEVHQLTPQAQESLLLPLENPPKQTYFILCTTEPQKLKVSLKRRCHQIILKAVTEKAIKDFLVEVVKEEGIENGFAQAITHISQNCGGSYGMALSMLDSIIDIEDDVKAYKAVSAIVAEVDAEAIDICRAVTKRDWREIQTLWKSYKGDPESTRISVLNYLAAVLLNSTGTQATAVAEQMSYFLEPVQYSKKAGLLLAIYGSMQ
jgi:DNA polymerase-3 subunit gamma/tau